MFGKFNLQGLRSARNNPIRAGLFSILAIILAVLFYMPSSGISANPLPPTSPQSLPPVLNNETLGSPSIPIAPGSDAIIAGVGLYGGVGVLQPGNI
jgi:hypothetical protein